MNHINNTFIYLDNASTSFPKPRAVLKAMAHYATHIGISPHRSTGHYGKIAEKVISDARYYLAQLFGIDHPSQISFTYNATYALNVLIKGILKEGDHVITSNFEHNAVLRPLHKLKIQKGISFDVVESNAQGIFDVEQFAAKITPKTRLIILNHASNVLGVISPIQEIGALAKKHGLLFLVDCAQTAGIVDIDVKMCQIDFLAGTSHKCLLGPSGVGFLYAKDAALVETLFEGGSGHNSASSFQPDAMPHKFEAGTLNYLGIAGLLEALKYLQTNQAQIRENEEACLTYLIDELRDIKGITIYGTLNKEKKVPLVSFNLQGIFPQELSFLLESEFSIVARGGLHCAPNIHKTLRTFPTGALRLSLGYKTTIKEIQHLLFAIQNIQRRISRASSEKTCAKDLLIQAAS